MASCIKYPSLLIACRVCRVHQCMTSLTRCLIHVKVARAAAAIAIGRLARDNRWSPRSDGETVCPVFNQLPEGEGMASAPPFLRLT